jgi:hypothetical protein
MSSVDKILAERETTYGDYGMQSRISQDFKRVVRMHDGRLTHFQRESLDMICNKMGRILNGNPNFIDSWDDIAGYATLVVNQLRKMEQHRSGTPEDGGHHERDAADWTHPHMRNYQPPTCSG